jgi:maltose O-acetyltransferase
MLIKILQHFLQLKFLFSLISVKFLILASSLISNAIAFCLRQLAKTISSNSPAVNGARILQPLVCRGAGCIQLNSCVVGVINSPFFLSAYTYMEAREASSSVIVSDDVWINNGCSLIASGGSIYIGAGTLLGPSVMIFTSDFHGLALSDRRSPGLSASVYISSNVFIGANVTILKGVHIGEGSVVGAGSVVTRSVPGGVIVAGNPARQVGLIPIA